MREIRVLTALPQERYCGSVVTSLHSLAGIRVTGSLHNASEVDGLARVGAFDVIVFDHDVPGRDWTWIKVINKVRAANRKAGFVLLSDFYGESENGGAIDDGAGRVLPKSCLPTQLECAIREVARAAGLFGEELEIPAPAKDIAAGAQPFETRAELAPTGELAETGRDIGKTGACALRAAIYCGLGVVLIVLAALHQSGVRDFGEVPYIPPISSRWEQASESAPSNDADNISVASNSATTPVQTSTSSIDLGDN